jgi:hypothetical protein
MLDTVWWLNDNFIILAIEGVMNKLNGTSCQELSHLRRVAASSDAFLVQNIPTDVWRLAKHLVQNWWKSHGLPEALRLLDTADTETLSDTGIWGKRFKLRWPTGTVLFQPEAQGDGKGAAVQTVMDGVTIRPEENVEAHPQTNPHPENAEGNNENDKTEVWESGVWHLWMGFL